MLAKRRVRRTALRLLVASTSLSLSTVKLSVCAVEMKARIFKLRFKRRSDEQGLLALPQNISSTQQRFKQVYCS